jgi:hypothetical protein
MILNDLSMNFHWTDLDFIVQVDKFLGIYLVVLSVKNLDSFLGTYLVILNTKC